MGPGDHYRGPARRLGRGLRDVSCRSYSVISGLVLTLPTQCPPGPAWPAPGRAGMSGCADAVLPTQAEALDERPVAADVGVAQVGQQATAAADQQQQPAAAVVVVLVHLEVLVQVVDPAGHERDLDLRRTGVTLTGRVLRKDLLLDFGVERHVAPH